jgi:oligoendopeptidase F
MSTESQTASRYEQTAWSLSELLESPANDIVDAQLRSIEERVARFEAARNELAPDLAPQRFAELLRDYERLAEEMVVVGAYGSLWFASDTLSEAALTYRNRVEQRLTEWENRLLFFTLWWKDLDDAAAANLTPDDPDARHFLAELRRFKPYTLDEASERIINLKDTNGIDAVLTLHSMLTNRLEFTLEVDGKPETLTRDALMSRAYSPDPDLRQAVYQELYRVYEREMPILAQIYVNRVRDWRAENVDLRHMASPIAVRNLGNDVPDEAVDALLEVCREQAALFQRYFRWKASRLGVKRLRRCDIYAPLASTDKHVEYTDAVDLVLETFRDFSPEFGGLATRVFAQDHVDSEIRRGKQGGAFCATVLPRHTPWLLINYTGRVRDVATLAHELGHAVHSLLAADHSVLTQHASLPLAETASVFAEMLLTERLLEEESDVAVQRELLGTALDDIYATVLRQAYFVHFERQAHDAVLDGCGPGDLHALYFEGLQEQFGDSVELSEAFRLEWTTIPHIFESPFYCYAYSFGQLLVLSLYQRFREQGEAFLPGYLRLLAHGGSARPMEILGEVGVDPTRRSFWRQGFAVAAQFLDRLEALP